MAWDVNSIVEVRFLYTAVGQKCMNVVHYKPSDDGGALNIVDLQFSFGAVQAGPNGLVPRFLDVFATDVRMDYVIVQQVYPRRVRQSVTVVDLPGLRPGNCHTQNVQWAITKLSDEATRWGKGGMRVGGMSATDIALGKMTVALQTDAGDLTIKVGATIPDDNVTVDYKPQILNKEPIPGTNPVKFRIKGSTPISACFLHTELRTANRRSIGKGD